MQLKKSIVGSMITLALASTSSAFANEVTADISKFRAAGNSAGVKKGTGLYIVQMKGQPAIAEAQDIGELLPSNQLVGIGKNNYNATTPAMQAYAAALEKKQAAVAGETGSINIIHSYKHTFNGFSAKLTEKQRTQLEAHPDVVAVYEDSLQKVNTSNTPAFLGLTGPGGQHSMDIKGEDVIIGVLDTGIVPEHPSFADDGSYTDPASIGWNGSCDAGEEAEAGSFNCNNKLIGARYYKDAFEASYEIQTGLGEFISPRDADGHGSHTASTAGGNEGVAAELSGLDAGTVSGIAPRARVAMYKVCWNSDYQNENGDDEAGCFYGDSMAAIDQAVVDGVDVINYSIGGSRTSLVTAAAAAKLRATQAGVFVSVSAGNSGPTAETVGTPAPWVTSVAASTYDGSSKVIGKELSINAGTDAGTSVLAIPTSFAPAADGLTGDVIATEDSEACDAADGTNPIAGQGSLSGNIALIARGSCSFTEKFVNAQDAGAIGVLIYTYDGTSPFAGGGADPAVNVPGSMISFNDGQALLTSISNGTTNVTFTDVDSTDDFTEIGNIMAAFSSRGPNTASYDIIKPDITAPGVKILAATTNTPMFGSQGNTFAYLQGTSMSSPHIAGMAALFKESNPAWSPAQIKSALMTTARQDLTKEDGSTPADPFDFGAGHASPVNAMDPGLLFDSNYADYLAFLCGIGENDFVNATETDCDTLAGSGFSTEPSQLNLPSIGIAELLTPETISRTVTNATDSAAVYTATIEAPEGVDVVLATFDAEGNPIADNVLSIDAAGTASFALTFTSNENAVVNEWKFGSITWTDGAGHVVRSPISIKVAPTVRIDVPDELSGTMSRGRFSFPVQMLYSGTTSIEHAGLVAPFGAAGVVTQDPDQTFTFPDDLQDDNYSLFHLFEGTQVARFSLLNGLVANEGADLDLYVYRCDNWLCTRVGASFNGGSNEDVVLVNPEPRADVSVGDVYLVAVHGWDVAADGELPVEEQSTEYTMLGWIADSAASTTRVVSSRRAIEGRYNWVSIMDRSLTPGVYMGGITFFDDEAEAQGTSVVEIVVEE
ncbi:S8 family serine peptidase [Thalassotalea atypica]|uniref:S8 family serine peptidase n=1 Tax=Thalassotalea atypica TaxID=2054316 RepID=UPI00257236E5|nr:S8 family serine peptidase [Thalassotalea atypica]